MDMNKLNAAMDAVVKLDDQESQSVIKFLSARQEMKRREEMVKDPTTTTIPGQVGHTLMATGLGTAERIRMVDETERFSQNKLASPVKTFADPSFSIHLDKTGINVTPSQIEIFIAGRRITIER